MIYNQPVLGVIRNPIYCITVSWAIIEGDVQPKKTTKTPWRLMKTLRFVAKLMIDEDWCHGENSLVFWWRLVDEDMAMCVFCLDISWGKLVNYSSFFLLAERWWTDGDVVIFWDFFRGIWRWCEKLRFGFVFWHSHGPFHKGLGSPWNVQTNPLVFWHGIIYWPAKNLSFFVGSLRLAMRIWDFQKLKLATFFCEINQR